MKLRARALAAWSLTPTSPALRLLAGLACALTIVNLAPSAIAAVPGTLSLAGQWRFQLDHEDAGERGRWCSHRLEQHIRLPGALQNQGFGDDITVDTAWVGDVGLDRWKRAPQYDQYRQPGHIKVPFFLQPQKHYVGVAWYQREFEVPAAWRGQRVVLTLERPHWETRVWVDGTAMGTNDSLSTPHVYDLGTALRPGKHTLTIRVDNRLIIDVGPMAHSVTDHTQGDWNGIVGRIELSATGPVWVEGLQAFPDVAAESVKVRGRIGNATGQPGRGIVKVQVRHLNRNAPEPSHGAANRSIEVIWSGVGGAFETTLALGPHAPLWDEFHPALFRLTAALEPGDSRPHEASARPSGLEGPRRPRVEHLHPGGMCENSPAFQRWDESRAALSPEGTAEAEPSDFSRPSGTYLQAGPNPALKRWATLGGPSGTTTANAARDPISTGHEPPHSFRSSQSVTFGLRDITARDREFILNGPPVFFRGTLECCVFPRTGYPPTDVDSWRRIIRVCKAHGLNHMRFHSWCPPEAAFVAADELGFYYQVECGVFGRVGDGKPVDAWIYRESERIVEAYGNHPSFLLFTHGNEPHGSKREQYLAKWVSYWKARDPRRLTTGGTAFPILPEDQFDVFHGARGAADWFGRDYGTNLAALTVPVIVHEMGQWCVYPNFAELKKYTGPLKARNFEIFRDSLAAHGMLGQRRDFLHASGRLQVLCYKEEIEAALGTPGIGGLQLLDLHDFPGQGTALVGVLDAFWDEKGYVTPAEYRRFCGPTVPLARLSKRTWTTAETLLADVRVAHFGPEPMENARVTWKLVAANNEVLASGGLAPRTLPLGQSKPLGTIRVPLQQLAVPTACRLCVKVGPMSRGLDKAGSTFENDWNVWIYPAQQDSSVPVDVLMASALDEPALSRLREGGKVLLVPTRLSWEHPKLYFEPVFWNRYMFNARAPQTLGLLVAARHPALAQFPTETFQDWQWDDIVTHAHGLVLDGLPAKLRPIVQPIDDWNSNRRLGLLFECLVGPGRLLVCTADLSTDLDQRPAAGQLRHSLLAYAGSRAFNPSVAVPESQLIPLFAPTRSSELTRLGAKVIERDSEDREGGHAAACALDGDADTFWHTSSEGSGPHWLVIDLGREVTLRGVTCLPRQDRAEGRVAELEAFCSNDSRAWGSPAATAKWRGSDQPQTLYLPGPVKARYLKLVVRSAGKGSPAVAIAELDVVTGSPRK